LNKEYKYVVQPLVTYLKYQTVNWKIHTPRHHTSETGWDIEARSKNLDLLIEAKFMDNAPFLVKLNSLITAPLAKRKRNFPGNDKPYAICWAMGSEKIRYNDFQRLWDYIIRNTKFWKHYIQDLKVKYIFLVRKDATVRMDFRKIVAYSSRYKKLALNKSLVTRRRIAQEIIRRHFKRIYEDFYTK